MGNQTSKENSGSVRPLGARASLNDYYVGQNIVIQGSGRRWSGQKFAVTVTDLREHDRTVKVRFTDGGFKRFDFARFVDLVEEDGGFINFGSQAYEWYADNYTPAEQERERATSDALKEQRKKIADATRSGDFETAAKLQKSFKRQHSLVVEGMRLKEALLSAVQKEDFEQAATIKKKLEEFKVRCEKAEKGGDPALAAAGSAAKEEKPIGEKLQAAGKRALGGGVAGAAAMVVQVTTLMWIRTIMNYQYRYGTSLGQATRTLYAEGGIPRFYRGYFAAMAQGPLSRFGDTAANVGVLALMDSSDSTRALPVAVKTIGASAGAASMRIFLTPIDTVKTIMQVEGKAGLRILFDKAKVQGPTAYYQGAMAAAAATFVGHYPWFATFNTLQEVMPNYEEKPKKLARNAFIGFTSSVVSDTISNSLRVVKTYRQTSAVKISYTDAVKNVVEQDGWAGLFGRGLKTRVLANGMQGLMFSVLWKQFDEEMKKKGWF